MIKIAHASDIQIRTFKRHKEFREHFKNHCASLKAQSPDIIALTGDVIHQKSNISPELVDLFVDYFRELSSIAPVHIIPGNHDGVLNNLSRLDSLSPIFKAMKDSRIHYYKHSGIYPIDANTNFVVFSCFDDESKWPTRETINKDKLNIGLFHGMVEGAKLQNGQIVESCPYKLKAFLSLVDYLLLGDIHAMQILDSSYRAAYAGSLIQQNYSESIEKGYLLWKIESKEKHSVDFIKLPNLYPFYSIYLDETLKVPTDLDFQKNSRIRVVSRGLTSAEKQKISEDVNQFYSPLDIDFLEVGTNQGQITISADTKVDNLEDPQVQEGLLKEFLKPYNLSDEKLEAVLALNDKYDIRGEEETLRNVQYVIEKMSFSNMFSYGENNEFDFSKRKGIIGIFGKNGSGKSSLVVDIPNYTIFNRVSKKGVVKNDLLINENKEDCGSSIQIRIGNDKYCITRATSVYLKSGKKAGDPIYQGKTEVDFKVIHADGTEEDKNGEQRDVTDSTIRKIFGSPEDFMATSVAPQWQLLGFVDAGGTERLRLVGRYFDIDIFDKKHKLAKEDYKEIKTKLKYFEEKKLTETLESNKNKLQETQNEIILQKAKKEEIANKIQELSSTIEKKEKVKETFSDKILSIKHERETIEEKIDELQEKVSDMMKYPCTKNLDCCLLKDVEKHKKSIERLTLQDNVLQIALKRNEDLLDRVNKENESSADEKKCELLEFESDKVVERLYKLTGQEGALKASIAQNEKDIEELSKLRKEYEIYDYFLLANSKDGISKQIVSKNLNIINLQIKKILSSGVNFDIELISEDDGKAIEILFKHEKGKPRKIELCSGMEKSLTAIAIRAALVSVTTLPRSNLFTLDEAFSSLDPEYLDAAGKILNYLKELFDAVIIVTHIDSFKDLADYVVEIVRNDEGYSRIVE